MKKWVIADIDKELAKALAEECDVDPFVAMIASSRGYKDAAALDEFLSDELVFASPFELTDMDKAAQCVNAAIENNEIIAVYGDYDCDGVTATALLCTYLKSRNVNTIYHIPNRFSEGYGMNKEAIKELYEKGATLIITVDNGISCFEEIEYANSLGMKVVVTDHHLPSGRLPNAEAVVNPHRADDYSEFKDICGVGVAFNLICAVQNAEPEEMIALYGDLVAVGTIGDVMPLKNENRSFVKAGIEIIKNYTRVGIDALLKAAYIEKEKINSAKISFGLVPRINAAGRMGSAERALQLLVTLDKEEAARLAEEITNENSLRQETEKEIFEEAKNIIESQGLFKDRVIVVAGEDWHHGIVGIVASRICENYGKPAIVLSIENDLAHGSGRSIEGFSLFECISYASKYTEKFGGHEQAAGITLKKQNIEAFRKSANEYARSVETAVPVLKLDCKLNPAALSIDLVEALRVIEPFGNGNNTPLFGIFAAELEKIYSVGSGKHLKLSFVKGPVAFQAMLFSVSEEAFPFRTGDVLDIAVGLDINLYNGKEYLSIIIKDYRFAGINDSLLSNEIALYDDFISGICANYSQIAPTREECGIIYKFINRLPSSYTSIEQRFMNSLGLAKVRVIIDILKELELIEIKKDQKQTVFAVNTGKKVDLESSTILSRVRG